MKVSSVDLKWIVRGIIANAVACDPEVQGVRAWDARNATLHSLMVVRDRLFDRPSGQEFRRRGWSDLLQACQYARGLQVTTRGGSLDDSSAVNHVLAWLGTNDVVGRRLWELCKTTEYAQM